MQTCPKGAETRTIATGALFDVSRSMPSCCTDGLRGPLLFHKCGVERWLGKAGLSCKDLEDLGCHWWIVDIMRCALHVILLAFQLHLHIRIVVKELPFGALAHQ